MPSNLPNIWRKNSDSSTSLVKNLHKSCKNLHKSCKGNRTIGVRRNNRSRVCAKIHYWEHRRQGNEGSINN